MSSSLGTGYIGVNVNIINDATQEALDTKADTTYVNTQLALKSDITYVDSELALKSDKTYVDTQLALKSDITYVDSELALKSDITYVDTQLALKSDKTYVDSELALKSDKTYVDTQLALKSDITYVDSELALKSDITYVDTQLALKSDKTYVDSELALKANLADGNTFTGDQIVDNIIVGGSIKAPSNSNLTFGVNSGGVPVTALSLLSTSKMEVEGSATFKKGIVGGISQSLTAGTQIIDNIRLITKLDTRAGDVECTITNGAEDGQIKIVSLHRADPQYKATILTNISEPITLKNVGEGVVLTWSGNTADWNVVSKNVSFLNNDLDIVGDVNLTTGKEYKVNGTNILDPYRTSADTDNLLNLKADKTYVDTELALKANDTDVVKLTGDQSISGSKTFTNDTLINTDLYLPTDDGKIILGANYDRKIIRTVDGIETNNTFGATKYYVSGVQISSNDLSDGASLAPINDADFTGHTKLDRLTIDHSDVSSIGIVCNNTNSNQYAGKFTTASHGWRFFNDNITFPDNVTFGVFTKGTGSQLNPLLIKNDGKVNTLDQEVNGDINMSAGHLYKIDGVDIFTPYRTSADTDTLLALKAPIHDADLTGNTKLDRLTIEHSDTASIGIVCRNTNSNQYAGEFTTTSHGWRFFNNNLSFPDNVTFGVFTKGTGSQLNPLLIKNDGKLYTLDQEVDGNVNLSAGHQFQIDGVNILDSVISGNNTALTGSTTGQRLTLTNTDTSLETFVARTGTSYTQKYAGTFESYGAYTLLLKNNLVSGGSVILRCEGNTSGVASVPLEVTGAGVVKTLNQEVNGNINLSLGKEFRINGQNILTGLGSSYVSLTDDQTISGTKTFDGKLNVEQLSFTRINTIYGSGYINTAVYGVSNIINSTASTLSITIQSGNTIGQQHLVIYRECSGEASIDTKNLPQVKIYGSNVRSKNLSNIDSVYMRATGEGILFTWNGTYWFPAVSNTSLEDATMYGTIKHAGTELSFVKDNAILNFTGANNEIKMSSTGKIKISNVELKNVAETLTNKTIDGNSNTISNISSAIADGELAISQVNLLQANLNLKANTVTVTEQLELKANTSYVVTQLSYKADKTYVDTNLAKKVDFSTLETLTAEGQINTNDYSVSAIDAETATTDWDITITDGTAIGQQHLVYIDKINPSITNTKDVKRVNIIGLNVKSYSNSGFNSVLMRLPGESAYLTWTGSYWVSQSSNRSLDQSTLYSNIKMAGNELNFANDNSQLIFSGANQSINMESTGKIKINNVELKDVTETLTNKTINTASNTLLNVKNAISNNDLTIAQTSGLQSALDEKVDLTSAQTITGAKVFQNFSADRVGTSLVQSTIYDDMVIDDKNTTYGTAIKLTNNDDVGFTQTATKTTISRALNLDYASIPLGTGGNNKLPPTSAVSGDIYRDDTNVLHITPPP